MHYHPSIKRKLTEVSEFPKDVVMGIPIINIMGYSEIYIENYCGIIEYTDTLIRVRTKVGLIKIIGKHLRIEYYTNDEMKINGRIDVIEYQH